MKDEEVEEALATIVKALVAFFTGRATLYVGALPITFKSAEGEAK